MILVDSDVLIDLVGVDTARSARAARRLEAAALLGPLSINPIIYTEWSMAFADVESLDRAMAAGGVTLEALPTAALVLAGKSYALERAAGVSLATRLIGAHALVADLRLLTNEQKNYRAAYPRVRFL